MTVLDENESVYVSNEFNMDIVWLYCSKGRMQDFFPGERGGGREMKWPKILSFYSVTP